MAKVTVYVMDQKQHESPGDAVIDVHAGTITVIDKNGEEEYGYQLGPRQYFKVQTLDSGTVVRVNE